MVLQKVMPKVLQKDLCIQRKIDSISDRVVARNVIFREIYTHQNWVYWKENQMVRPKA